MRSILLSLLLASGCNALTLIVEPPTNTNGAPLSDVRYVWVINGTETITSSPTNSNFNPGPGTTTIKCYAEYATTITDYDGTRQVWTRDPEGTNTATIRQSVWQWLKKLFVRG